MNKIASAILLFLSILFLPLNYVAAQEYVMPADGSVQSQEPMFEIGGSGIYVRTDTDVRIPGRNGNDLRVTRTYHPRDGEAAEPKWHTITGYYQDNPSMNMDQSMSAFDIYKDYSNYRETNVGGGWKANVGGKLTHSVMQQYGYYPLLGYLKLYFRENISIEVEEGTFSFHSGEFTEPQNQGYSDETGYPNIMKGSHAKLFRNYTDNYDYSYYDGETDDSRRNVEYDYVLILEGGVRYFFDQNYHKFSIREGYGDSIEYINLVKRMVPTRKVFPNGDYIDYQYNSGTAIQEIDMELQPYLDFIESTINNNWASSPSKTHYLNHTEDTFEKFWPLRLTSITDNYGRSINIAYTVTTLPTYESSDEITTSNQKIIKQIAGISYDNKNITYTYKNYPNSGDLLEKVTLPDNSYYNYVYGDIDDHAGWFSCLLFADDILEEITTPGKLNIKIKYEDLSTDMSLFTVPENLSEYTNPYGYNDFYHRERSLFTFQNNKPLVETITYSGANIPNTLIWQYSYSTPEAYLTYRYTPQAKFSSYKVTPQGSLSQYGYKKVEITTSDGNYIIKNYEQGLLVSETKELNTTTETPKWTITYDWDYGNRYLLRKTENNHTYTTFEEYTYDGATYSKPRSIERGGNDISLFTSYKYRHESDTSLVNKNLTGIISEEHGPGYLHTYSFTVDGDIVPESKSTTYIGLPDSFYTSGTGTPATLTATIDESYIYDSLFRLTDITLPTYKTLSLGYSGPYPSSTTHDDISLTKTETFVMNTGQVDVITALNGKEMDHEYYSSGKLKEIKYNDSETDKETFSYPADFEGVPLNEVVYTNREGLKTHYHFDGFGRTTRIKKRDSADTFNYEEIEYEYRLNTNSITNMTITRKESSTGVATSRTSTQGYDQFGRITSITNPDGNNISIVYDSNNGAKKTVTDSNSKSKIIIVNGIGKIAQISETNQKGASGTQTLTASYTYDSAGNLEQINDYNSKVHTYYTNGIGYLQSYQSPYHGLLKYKYDTVGNLTHYYTQNGNITYSEFDSLGNNTYMDLSSISGSNDYTFYYHQASSIAQGKMHKVDLPDGNTVEYDYDLEGNMTQVKRLIGTKTHTIDYDYNTLGLLESITDEKGVTSYHYSDEMHRLKEIQRGTQSIAKYKYRSDSSDFGNPYRIEFNGDDTFYTDISYESVNSDRISLLSSEFNAASLLNMGYSYDSVGNRTGSSFTDSSGTVIAGSYTYDSLNQLRTLNYPNGIGTEYRYEDSGNRTYYSHPFGEFDLDYTTIDNEGNTVDNGRLEKYTVGDITVAYGYDGNGNISSKAYTGLGFNKQQTFTFNEQNRLTHVTDIEDGNTYQASFSYDHAGKRYNKVTSKGNKSYIWGSHNKIIAEANYDTGAIQKIFIYTPKGERLAHLNYNPNAELRYYLNNPLRTPVKIVKSDGSPVNQKITGPFGNLTFAKGNLSLSNLAKPIKVRNAKLSTEVTDEVPYESTEKTELKRGTRIQFTTTGKRIQLSHNKKEQEENPYTLTGHEEEPDLGLIYMQQRWHDPVAGRFLSVDPLDPYNYINDPLQLNPYLYARNNPGSNIDVDGRLTVHIWDYRGSKSAWGHASITLDNGTHISWWPGRNRNYLFGSNIPIYTADAREKQTLGHDIRFEDAEPAHSIRIIGLDEEAIDMWWNSFRKTNKWKTFNQNCSTTAAEALKAGGAKVNWSDRLKAYNMIWSPNDVLQYSQAVNDYSYSDISIPSGSSGNYFDGDDGYSPPVNENGSMNPDIPHTASH